MHPLTLWYLSTLCPLVRQILATRQKSLAATVSIYLVIVGMTNLINFISGLSRRARGVGALLLPGAFELISRTPIKRDATIISTKA